MVDVGVVICFWLFSFVFVGCMLGVIINLLLVWGNVWISFVFCGDVIMLFVFVFRVLVVCLIISF